MKDEAVVWLKYAEENLTAAHLLYGQKLFNPCLQNVQQCVEKGLKTLLLEKMHTHRKTHAITELVQILAGYAVEINIAAEDCDLLDAIYLPSKYPLGSVLPYFEPDDDLCICCLRIAKSVMEQVKQQLGVNE